MNQSADDEMNAYYVNAWEQKWLGEFPNGKMLHLQLLIKFKGPIEI